MWKADQKSFENVFIVSELRKLKRKKETLTVKKKVVL